MSRLEHSNRQARSSPHLESLFRAVGVDRTIAEQLLGDLDETYSERAERYGVAAAASDYVVQLLRSAPHLALGILRNGSRIEQARLALATAALASVAAATVMSVAGFRKGPPARLFAEHTAAADHAVVVNNTLPVHLPMRVVDDRERRLDSTGVAYRWISGVPMTVTPGGAVTCSERGDAVVRASLGPIASDVLVRCQPVGKIEAMSWITLLEDGAAQELPFTAVGVDGRPVSELRGSLRIKDSTIATLSGSHIRPIAPGETEVVVTVGNATAIMRVLVHERVERLTGLRPDQRHVAIPIRLAQGDTVRIPIPRGVYWVKYLSARAGDAPPTISTDVTCGPGDGLRVNRIPLEEYATYCLIMTDAGSITLGHGYLGAVVVEGTLAVERLRDRW